MLDVSVLYGQLEVPSTPHRYGRPIRLEVPSHQRMELAKESRLRRPIVVWNLTRGCNLRCVHCYTDSAQARYQGELSTDQCKAVLDDLAQYKVPAVLFSGGEPLLRPDFFDLAAHARNLGLHVVISTNGTLIDESMAKRFADLQLAYVGISLDSADAAIHDRFRGVDGAFDRTLRGLRYCVAAGQKVGLRLTLTRQTCGDIEGIFRFIERENIHRACFYHLCPAGRGAELASLAPCESRRAVDTILDCTRATLSAGRRVEILTVDNHCDGPYLYLRMMRENNPLAPQVLEMLRWNGGARYSSGVGIANIDFLGRVHADQFSMQTTLGNVLERPFSEIWSDETQPVLAGLRDRIGRITGRCATCRFLEICGGSLRARAQNVTGDLWASDPGCYLTDEEIAGEPV